MMLICRSDTQCYIDVVGKSAHHLGIHVFLQVSLAQTPVPVISDVSAVHDLSKQVSQIFPGHLGVGLEVVVQDIHADGQISRVEGIDSVPALRAELTTFADHGVEVTQREQDALELCFSCAHL